MDGGDKGRTHTGVLRPSDSPYQPPDRFTAQPSAASHAITRSQ
jgi:hypothetical protein